MTDEQVVYHFANQIPQRLDRFLVSCLPDYSRTRLQALIKDGLVLVDGQVAHKSGQWLEAPAEIQVTIPATQPSQLLPEDIPLSVIFENQHLLVIDKPAGMVVHPALGHPSGTLVHAALGHAPEMEGVGGEQRPGVVHRLDKDTSGLILLAKDDKTHQWLQDQFRQRKVQKFYLALVDGHPPTPSGRIEAAIGRDLQHRKQMAILPEGRGRQAISEYRTLETLGEYTLLEVKPVTGRTHQIRLHLAFLGCPVAGDRLYGRRHSSLPIARHFLHAYRLLILLPGEAQPHSFEAPLPDDLTVILDSLRAQMGIQVPPQ